MISFGVGWVSSLKMMDCRHYMGAFLLQFRSFDLVKRRRRYGLIELRVSFACVLIGQPV